MHVDGLFLLDKPTGLSSHTAVQQVKRAFQACKAGHAGTLDPLASGLLPIALGEGTKFLRFLLDSDKTYWVKARLGVSTTTGDSEGEITQSCSTLPEYTLLDIQEACRGLVGRLVQTPPMYSAVKHQGRPLYTFARKGQVIQRASRTVFIQPIEWLSYQAPELCFRVRCSKGTYIRVLVEDIGRLLDQRGACVTGLRRLELGPFKTMHGLAAIQSQIQDFILPIDAGLQHLPAVSLSKAEVKALFYGQSILPVDEVGGLVTAHWVGFYDEKGLFLGVGQWAQDRLSPCRLIRGIPV